MKNVVLLGATGSIGENALKVIAAHPGELRLAGAAAHSNWRKLAEIARRFGPRQVAVFDERSFEAASQSGLFPPGTELLRGAAGLEELARMPEAGTVLVAVLGTAGLKPALSALESGKELALATKEILVLAGRFVMAASRQARGAAVVPVDSEHNAVFQCIEGHPVSGVRRVMLTASGGALRDWPLERLAHATPEDALRHPNWSMGPKVTLDAATLANKGLELIEAQWLFDLRPEQCTALLHPQSIAHCLVEFHDGAMLAQLSPPSMTFPIQHALLHPRRLPGVAAPLDLSRVLSLEFRPVDEARYPMYRLARQAMEAGGAAPAVFNGANEVAGRAFLDHRIPFLAISRIVEQTLADGPVSEPPDLASALQADGEARRLAESFCNAFPH